MAEQLLVNHPDYWKSSVKPRGFAEFCDMVDTQGKITGLWELVQWDPKTGDVSKRIWNKNVVTDSGAVNILASAIAAASNANPWNQIYINNNSGSTTLTTAASGTITSMAVAALPANIPALTGGVATQVQVNFGSTPTQNFTLSGAASVGATTISVNSQAVSQTWPIGTIVVPLPSVAENPAAGTSLAQLTGNAPSAGVIQMYSGALAGGAFTYAATTGAGNRSCVATFTFKVSANGGTTPAGNYSDAWLVNVGSGATNTTTGVFVGNYICHEINTIMACGTNNNISVSITIKL